MKNAIACTIAVLATAAAAHAATLTVYNSDGFDTRFIAGPLQGQDATQGPWQVTRDGTSTATVMAGIGTSGMGVRLNTAPGQTDTEYFVSKPMLPTAAAPLVNVTWSQKTFDTNAAGLEFGPFLGVEAFDALSNTPQVKQIGGFGVDASTGQLLALVNDRGVPFFDTLDVDTFVPFGSYQSLGMTLNYTTKTYTVTLGGVALQTLPFVDPTATAFTDAPLATRFVSNNGEQALSAGTADFDNYVISVSTVPEPTALAGLAAVGLLLGKRRR